MDSPIVRKYLIKAKKSLEAPNSRITMLKYRLLETSNALNRYKRRDDPFRHRLSSLKAQVGFGRLAANTNVHKPAIKNNFI